MALIQEFDDIKWIKPDINPFIIRFMIFLCEPKWIESKQDSRMQF